MTELDGLPAADRISNGLRDLAAGVRSADALLVAIASRRLTELGLDVRSKVGLTDEPELALYDLLCDSADDPFYAYGAALRDLDSFVSALEAHRAVARRRQVS